MVGAGESGPESRDTVLVPLADYGSACLKPQIIEYHHDHEGERKSLVQRLWFSPGLLRLTFCILRTNARCLLGFSPRWYTHNTLAGEG